MNQQSIQKTIEINATLEKVWSVFTDAEITKQMGGFYNTDWGVGNSFGFSRPDGTPVTHGILLAFQPLQTIKHNLFDEGNDTVISEVTYMFHEEGGLTVLTGREDLVNVLDPGEYEDAVSGWEEALNEVKLIAESL